MSGASGDSETLPARVVAADDVVWQEVDGKVSLTTLGDERFFALDAVGSRMWELLDESRDVAAAYDRLLALYAVDPETLRTDLAAFIASLVDRGLLRVEA
jgi:hypothetical protein